MLDYALLPPEINSLRMYTGPGAMPLIEAAQSWTTLATGLQAATSEFSSTVASLSTTWLGPSSLAMQNAALQYRFWLTQTAMRCEQTTAQAMAAVEAYQAAYAMTVPPAIVTANRVLLAHLVATNFLGINAPAIAATEAHYAEMWAQDAAAMYQYLVASAEAWQLDTFTMAPQITSLVSEVRSPAQASFTSLPQPPQWLVDLANLLSGNGTGPWAQVFNDVFSANGIGLNSTVWNTIFSSGFYTPSSSIGPFLGLLGLDAAATNNGTPSASEGGPTTPPPPPGVPEGPWMTNTPQASFSSASRIGQLAVPPSWGQSANKAVMVSSATPIAETGENGEAGFPGVPGVPLVRPAGTSTDAPKYGSRPTVMTRPPSGG